MNNTMFQHIIRFVGLVLLQVLILNNINFMGYINPYPYIWFVLLLPLKLDQWKVIFYGFIIGLTIDLFEDTGGINAAATLVIAYLRPIILKFSFGISYDYQTVKFNQTPISQRITYIVILVLIHHFVLFLLEVFNFTHIIFILKNTLYSSIFSIIILVLFAKLFQKRK